MVKLGGNLGNFSLKICQSMEFGLCTWESWVKIENLSTEVSRWVCNADTAEGEVRRTQTLLQVCQGSSGWSTSLHLDLEMWSKAEGQPLYT